jgi:hypothetical protein
MGDAFLASAKKVNAKMEKLRSEASEKKEAKPKSAAAKKVATVVPVQKTLVEPKAAIEPIPEQRQQTLKLDQFQVLQLLKKERKALSRDAIFKHLGIDVQEKHLASSLR